MIDMTSVPVVFKSDFLPVSRRRLYLGVRGVVDWLLELDFLQLRRTRRKTDRTVTVLRNSIIGIGI